jgi:hypothetical protein
MFSFSMRSVLYQESMRLVLPRYSFPGSFNNMDRRLQEIREESIVNCYAF